MRATRQTAAMHAGKAHAVAVQRGFLLIASVVLIVVATLILTVMVFLSVTGNESSVGHSQSGQALFAAETGLERAQRGYRTGTACSSLAYAGNIGEGSFSTTGTAFVASASLGANITAASTVIPVASTAGFASHGRIRIENEDIDYGALSTSCAPFASPACFTGAERGVNGTTAAAHNTGAGVNTAQNQCLIRSIGTVAGTRRVLEKVIQNPGAMLVYAQANGDGNVYYRRWDGSQWGAQLTATAVTANIHFFVLKFARTRNEAMLGTLTSNGEIRVQVWNGSAWGAATLLANIGAGDSGYRGFDIEYETNGDRAIVVYNDNTADPNYRIWDGATWSAATDINLPTTGEARWIELAPNPLSNELAMITLDANADVYGMRWPGGGAPGSAWNNMGAGAVWDASAANSGATKAIDVAYEQQSGRALFMWGDANNDDQYYRVWNGAVLGANTLLTIGAMAGTANRIRLAPDPSSNRIMYAVQDSGRDLNTALWTGAAWGTLLEHDNNTEDGNDRNFDVVFETHPARAGNAWLVWGTRAGADTTARRLFTGGAWGASATYGDDAALVQALALPRTGEVFAVVYQDTGSASDDITESHLLNGAGVWSAESVIWNGGVVPNPVYTRALISGERFISVVDWVEARQ